MKDEGVDIRYNGTDGGQFRKKKSSFHDTRRSGAMIKGPSIETTRL